MKRFALAVVILGLRNCRAQAKDHGDHLRGSSVSNLAAPTPGPTPGPTPAQTLSPTPTPTPAPTPAPTTAPTTAPTSFETLIEGPGGKCVDSSPENDDNLYMYDCQPDGKWAENQHFKYDAETKEIKLTRRDGCVDWDLRTDKNDNVNTWTCHDVPNQKWTYDPYTNQIKSDEDPTKCLEAKPDANNPDANNNLVMDDCAAENENQRFFPSGAGFPMAPSMPYLTGGGLWNTGTNIDSVAA